MIATALVWTCDALVLPPYQTFHFILYNCSYLPASNIYVCLRFLALLTAFLTLFCYCDRLIQSPRPNLSGGAHLRDLAPGQHSSKETSQPWGAVGDTASDLTGLRIEPRTFRADNDVFSHFANQPISFNLVLTMSILLLQLSAPPSYLVTTETYLYFQ